MNNAWLSMITGCQGSKLLLKNNRQHGWYLAFGTDGKSACLGIPVQRVLMGELPVFIPDSIDKYTWLPILDLTEWTATSFIFKSPLYVRIATGIWPEQACVMTWDDRYPEEPLLRHACRQGFWSMSKTGLKRIAKHLGIGILASDSVHDIIAKIAKHEWGDEFSDGLELQILRSRIAPKNEAVEMLMECEEATDLMDKSDQAMQVSRNTTMASEMLRSFWA